MGTGTITKGEDGIAGLRVISGVTVLGIPVAATTYGAIPCLTSWSVESSAELNERTTRCMLSNGDGGTAAGGDWSTSSITSKSWSVECEFYFQNEINGLPEAGKWLDPQNIGAKFNLEIYPNEGPLTDPLVLEARKQFLGQVILEEVSIESEVDGDITVSVTFKGTGPFTTTDY